ncbi:MAG TPA: PQQ-binding-like beta-propeller repeat protein [Candidatus Limnocylindria bacterium]|nr:PQQ-binding-like beta-propeller repeat protein [Candidatus Limnocylindria bacterium]
MLVVSLQVVNPPASDYFVLDESAGVDYPGSTNLLALPLNLSIADVGWHRYILHTNQGVINPVFNGVAQTNSVGVHVRAKESDLLWYEKNSIAFNSAPSAGFVGGCLINSDCAVLNLGSLFNANCRVRTLSTGYPQRVFQGCGVQAAGKARDLFLFDGKGNLLSCDILTGATNWIRPGSNFNLLPGSRFTIDLKGNVNWVESTASPDGHANVYRVLDYRDGTPVRKEIQLAASKLSIREAVLGAGGQTLFLGFNDSGKAVALENLVPGLRLSVGSGAAIDSTGRRYLNTSAGVVQGGYGFPVKVGAYFSEFTLVKDDLVVGSRPVDFACYSFASNSVLWSIANSTKISQSAALLSESICAFLRSDGINIVDIETGHVRKVLNDFRLWNRSPQFCQFAISEQGVLLIGSSGGCAAYDVREFVDPEFISKGNGCWHRFGATGRNDQHQPTIPSETNILASVRTYPVSRFSVADGEAVYSANRDGLSRFDLGLEAPLWNVTQKEISSELIVDGEGLYFCTGGGAVQKRNKSDGGLIWESSNVGPTPDGEPSRHRYQTPFAADAGHLYSADDAGRVACWNKSDGQMLWSVWLRYPVVGRMALAMNGQLNVAIADGSVVSLDSGSGALLWQADLGDSTYAHLGLGLSPTGSLVVPLDDGRIVFLDLATGSLARTVNSSGAALQLPVIAEDGTIFWTINQAGNYTVMHVVPGGADAQIVAGGKGVLADSLYLLGDRELLISDKRGTALVIDVTDGKIIETFPTFSRTMRGFRHIRDRTFLMDGDRLATCNVGLQLPADYRVLGADGAADNSHFWVANQTIPGPISAPRNVRVTAGGDLAMLAPVLNTNVLSYQWSLDGIDLDGQTNYFLNLTRANSSQAGIYGLTVRTADQTNTLSLYQLAVSNLGNPGEIRWRKAGGFYFNQPVIENGGSIVTLTEADGTIQLSRISPTNGSVLSSLVIATNDPLGGDVAAATVSMGTGRAMVDISGGLFDASFDPPQVNQVLPSRPPQIANGIGLDYSGNVIVRGTNGLLFRYSPETQGMASLVLPQSFGTRVYCSDAIALPGNRILAIGSTTLVTYDDRDQPKAISTNQTPNVYTASFGYNFNTLTLDEESRLCVRLLTPGTPTQLRLVSFLPPSPSISSAFAYDGRLKNTASELHPMLSSSGGIKVTFEAERLLAFDLASPTGRVALVAGSPILGLATGDVGEAYIATIGGVACVNVGDGVEKWHVDFPLMTPEGQFVGVGDPACIGLNFGDDGSLIVQTPDCLFSIWTGAPNNGPGWHVRRGSPDGSRRPVRGLKHAEISDAADGSVNVTVPGILPGLYTLGTSTNLVKWTNSLLVIDALAATNGIQLPTTNSSRRFFRIR